MQVWNVTITNNSQNANYNAKCSRFQFTPQHAVCSKYDTVDPRCLQRVGVSFKWETPTPGQNPDSGGLPTPYPFRSVMWRTSTFRIKSCHRIFRIIYSRVGSIYIADIYHWYISDILVWKYRIFSIFSIFIKFFLNIWKCDSYGWEVRSETNGLWALTGILEEATRVTMIHLAKDYN